MTPAESSSTGGPRSVGEIMAQLAALGVHHEELQVVSEELRVQQEQVLGRHEVEARWRSQLEANPALATTVEVGLSRLRGKPLSVFLSPADTLPFREALRSLARSDGASGGSRSPCGRAAVGAGRRSCSGSPSGPASRRSPGCSGWWPPRPTTPGRAWPPWCAAPSPVPTG